jgi:response regulator of citrate/malate metabolism
LKKILVADVPQMDARYSAALGGWEIGFVRTLGQARQALAAARHDVVAIGVYFDDSRMFDFLRVLRADRVHGEVPVVCVRGRPGFAAVTTRTLETTVKALGADEFLDLLDSGDEAAASAALHAAVERLVKG